MAITVKKAALWRKEIDNLPGTLNIQGAYYGFQIPGTGTAPVTFYMRVSDARGDARPDFIYTFSVYGVN